MERAKFRYLPHTADIAFVAYGRSFKELLENSARAMLGLMFDTRKIGRSGSRTMTIRVTESASSMDDALWFVLQRIVSKVDEKGVDAFGFKVNSIAKSRQGIKVRGCVFYKRMREYSALLDVKGVTPHELRVSKTSGGYTAKVLVDV